MESRNHIINELKELAPGLASINPVIPYQVPQGYFESLPETILSLVRAEEVSSVLIDSKQNPNQIPSDYFENLADSILNKVKALENGSADEELAALSPLLNKLDKKAPFAIPEGYFDELPANIADGAKAIAIVNQELENLSPVMSGLKGINVYEAPAGYFDTLPSIILKKAKQQPGKVLSINFGRKMMRYAAAAAIAGLMFIAGWMLIDKPTAADPDKIVKTVPEEEIINYLDNSSTVPLLASTEEITNEDMKDMLADVSDEELSQYIEQSAASNNTVTN